MQFQNKFVKNIREIVIEKKKKKTSNMYQRLHSLFPVHVHNKYDYSPIIHTDNSIKMI